MHWRKLAASHAGHWKAVSPGISRVRLNLQWAYTIYVSHTVCTSKLIIPYLSHTPTKDEWKPRLSCISRLTSSRQIQTLMQPTDQCKLIYWLTLLIHNVIDGHFRSPDHNIKITIKIILFTEKRKKKLHSADLHDAATNETSFSNLPLTGRVYSDMLDLINKQLLKLQN